MGAARVTREASMAKMYATEAAQRVIDAAVQLWGGLGVTRGNMVESLYREVRALRIYECTTEINTLVIDRKPVGEGKSVVLLVAPGGRRKIKKKKHKKI